MEEFKTGAIRDTGGKGRMDLLPWAALLRISKHMENAVADGHYPERNWEKGMPVHNMLDSALRHLAKYMDGWTDEDHLAAAATNLLMAMWTEEKRPDQQDIPSRSVSSPYSSLPPQDEALDGVMDRIFQRVKPLDCVYYNNGVCTLNDQTAFCHSGGCVADCSYSVVEKENK